MIGLSYLSCCLDVWLRRYLSRIMHRESIFSWRKLRKTINLILKPAESQRHSRSRFGKLIWRQIIWSEENSIWRNSNLKPPCLMAYVWPRTSGIGGKVEESSEKRILRTNFPWEELVLTKSRVTCSPSFPDSLKSPEINNNHYGFDEVDWRTRESLKMEKQVRATAFAKFHLI